MFWHSNMKEWSLVLIGLDFLISNYSFINSLRWSDQSILEAIVPIISTRSPVRTKSLGLVPIDPAGYLFINTLGILYPTESAILANGYTWKYKS